MADKLRKSEVLLVAVTLLLTNVKTVRNINKMQETIKIGPSP